MKKVKILGIKTMKQNENFQQIFENCKRR